MPARDRLTLNALVWGGIIVGTLVGLEYGVLPVLGAGVLCLVDWRWRVGK